MTRPLISARMAQTLIAVPFLGLGGWCLFFPSMVEELSLRPEHVMGTKGSAIIMGCFGAQAMLAGIFALFSRFTATTFLAYGVALLPFFGFNYYFTLVDPVFTSLMLLDFGANAVMLVLCWLGWKAARLPGRA